MSFSRFLGCIFQIWLVRGVRIALRKSFRHLQDSSLLETSMSFPEDLLGRFRNPHRIGGGGDGDVYTALDAAKDSEEVIVKVVKEGEASECAVLMEIFGSAGTAKEEGAMHVARCLEQGTSNSSASWMIQESGGTEDLNDVFLSRNVPVNWSMHRAKKFFRQLLSAIAFINRHGYKHADLHTHFGNVMVQDITSDDPQVKLIDFGRAERVDREPLDWIDRWWWPLLGVPAQKRFRILNQMPDYLRGLVLDEASSIKVSQDSPVQNVTLSRMKDLCAAIPTLDPERSFPGIHQDLRDGSYLPNFGGPLCQPEASERWMQVCSSLGENQCDTKPKADLLAMFVVAHISLIQDALLKASELFDWCEVGSCTLRSNPAEVLKMKQFFKQTFGEAVKWENPSGKTVEAITESDYYTIEKVCTQSCASLAANKTLSRLVLPKTILGMSVGLPLDVPCCMEVTSMMDGDDGDSFGFLGKVFGTHAMKKNLQFVRDAQAVMNYRIPDEILMRWWQEMFTPAGLAFLEEIIKGRLMAPKWEIPLTSKVLMVKSPQMNYRDYLSLPKLLILLEDAQESMA